MKTQQRFTVLFLVGICFAPAARAADLKVPDCPGLLNWAKTYHPSKVTQIGPRVTLDNIFASDVTSPLFGKPALEWNQGEFRAVGQALAKCGQAYRKQRNGEAFQAMKTARGAMGRSLRGAINYLARTANNLESVRKGLLNKPATPATYRTLAAFDTAAKIKQRYRNIAGVPDEKIQGIAKDVAALRAKIRGEAVKKAETSIKGLPATARSFLRMDAELGAVRSNFDDTPERKDIAALEALVGERRTAIRGQLTAANPGNPPMIFPECGALYKWAAATNTAQPVRAGSGMIYNTMQDEKLVPVFGRPLDAWSDEDLALFRDGTQACMQASYSQTPRQQPPGLQQAQLLAGLLPAGREALGRNKKSKAALAGLRERVEKAPQSLQGIQELNRIRVDPSLAGLDSLERRRFNQVIVDRQQKIAAGLMIESTKGLEAFKRGFEDLRKIGAYRNTVMSQVGRLADAGAIGRFEAAFRQRDGQIATSALPEFKKKLAALPIDPESIKVAKQAVDDLVGPRIQSYRQSGFRSGRPSQGMGQGALPDYLAPYREAAVARAKQIETALHEAKCKKTLSGVKLSSKQASMEVLGALGPTTMGDLVCRMITTGNKFHSLASPGMFGGKDHTLKITVDPMGYQTVILRVGEIAPGKKALVGFSIADANQKKTLSVKEWQVLAGMLTGQSMEAGMKALEGVFRNLERQRRQSQQQR